MPDRAVSDVVRRDRAGGKRETDRLARQTRILDAAEQRFAEAGYEGTVLRDVTRLAWTRLSSVTDDFGGKEQLFRAVLMRRAHPLERARQQALAQIPSDCAGADRLQAVVRAYIEPMRQRAHESSGWRSYFRFIAQLANSHHAVKVLVDDDYNRSAHDFCDAIRAIYPQSPDEHIYDSFLLMLANALEVFADNGRIDSLSAGTYHSADLDRRCQALYAYVGAGMHAALTRS